MSKGEDPSHSKEAFPLEDLEGDEAPTPGETGSETPSDIPGTGEPAPAEAETDAQAVIDQIADEEVLGGGAAAAAAAEAEEEAEKEPGAMGRLTQSLRETSPYTAMLAIALVALLIAILAVLMEWGGYYGFKSKPNAAAQPAAASTIAVA